MIRAYTFQSATWARSAGDDWGPSAALADECFGFASDATYAWMICRKGSVFALRCWRKSDKNRVPALDLVLTELTANQPSAIEIVHDYILILYYDNAASTDKILIVAKPTLS